MARIRNAMREVSINNLSVGASCWVDVTCINNPHCFYVRPRVFRMHLPFLQARGEKIEASEIKLGDIHIFKSRILRCYARGKVLKIEGDTDPLFKLLAIDFGCIEKEVSIHRIWQLYHKSNVPGLVTHCQLADCMPLGNTWDNEAIDAMKNFVEGERAKIIVRSKTLGAISVELYNSCPDDIATLLALTGYTSFRYVYSSPMEFPMLLDHYHVARTLKVKTPLRVQMISGTFPENFYVVLVDEYKTYLQDRNDFRYYSQSQKTININELEVDAPIGIYYDGVNEYERGIIKELHAVTNKVRVKLVDRGTEVVEHISRMKAVPEWYLRIPARAIYCTVHKSQFLSTKMLNHYTNASGEFLISIEELGKDNAPNSVIIAHVPA